MRKPYFLQCFRRPLKKGEIPVNNRFFSLFVDPGRPKNENVLCVFDAHFFNESRYPAQANAKLGSGAKNCCFSMIFEQRKSKMNKSPRASFKKMPLKIKNRTPPQPYPSHGHRLCFFRRPRLQKNLVSLRTFAFLDARSFKKHCFVKSFCVFKRPKLQKTLFR